MTELISERADNYGVSKVGELLRENEPSSVRGLVAKALSLGWLEGHSAGMTDAMALVTEALS